MPDRQGSHDAVLRGVGVLIFVDEQMAEAAGLGAAQLGKLREQVFGHE